MRTIRGQLTQKLIASFAFLLVSGGLVVFFAMRHQLAEEFNATLRTKGLGIAAVTRQRGDGIEVEPAGRLTASLFEIWRPDGVVLERSESLGSADLPLAFGTADRPRVWDMTLPNGAAGRAVGFRFVPRGLRDEREPAKPGELVLVVASARAELDETLQRLAALLLGTGLLLLGTTWLVVARVLGRELAPLNKLAECAAQINAGSLATRFPTSALPGELAPITNRLNDLLARLEESFERERQFSADLAHELRTARLVVRRQHLERQRRAAAHVHGGEHKR